MGGGGPRPSPSLSLTSLKMLQCPLPQRRQVPPPPFVSTAICTLWTYRRRRIVVLRKVRTTLETFFMRYCRSLLGSTVTNMLESEAVAWGARPETLASPL
jgi:hypothetical protein